MRLSFHRKSGLVALAISALSACSGSQRSTPSPPSSSAPAAQKKLERGHIVGTFAGGTFGPQLTSNGRDRLVFWLTQEASASGVFAAPLSAGGTLGPATRLLDSPPRPTFCVDGESVGDRVLILVGAEEDGGSSLETVQVASDGALVRADRDFARGTRIGWADGALEDGEGVVFWSDRTESGTRLSARTLTGQGPGATRVLSESALVWQMRSSAEGPVIAFVEDQGDDLELVLGALRGDQVERISLSRPSGNVDGLDLVFHDQGGVIVFSEQGVESNTARLFALPLARDLSPAGAPKPLTRERGNQSLRALLSRRDPASVRLAWEEKSLNPRAGTRTFFGRLTDDGSLEELGFLDSSAENPLLPELALRGEDLVALAQLRSRDGRSRAAAQHALLVLEPDQAAAFPVSVPGSSESATFAWDLSCVEESCRFLAAKPVNDGLTTFWVEPGPASKPSDVVTFAPRALSPLVANEKVLPLPSLTAIDVAAVPSDETGAARDELLLSLTYFDPTQPVAAMKKPAADGKMMPEQARLSTSRLGELGSPLDGPRIDPAQPISLRARSPGGASLSSFEDGRALAGWAALDGGKPHVFLTLVDPSGKKLRQQMLTKAGAEVFDVTVARTRDGFVVLWIDDRSGNADVYGALLDRDLKPRSGEVRLTEGAIEPSDLVVEVSDEEILFAYSARLEESRFALGAGLFLGVLDPVSGGVKAAPALVRRSDFHAFSPRFLGGFGVGWLEAPTERSHQGPTGRVMMARIDRRGMRLASVRELPVPGNAAGLATHCAGEVCRAVVLTKDPADQRVFGTIVSRRAWTGGEPIEMKEMFSIPNLLHEGAAPVLIGDALYYSAVHGAEGPAVWRAELRFSEPSSSRSQGD